MPARYEAIRDSLVKQGYSLRDAERIAAATYQKTRKPGEMELNRAAAQEKKGK